ncbi:MAG: hypothetical protein QMD46_12290 [Methanomicrobiales archaeon]|nr:hypothetical protein [Methanomicrobiales archaeon]
MTERYLLASQRQISWGDEGATPYVKAATLTNPFGLIVDDVTFPKVNPKTAKATAGGIRGPHLFSKDEYDLSFTVPFEILDDKVPFQCAIGPDSPVSGTGYTGTKFTSADILETVTVERCQRDAALIEDYVGCKADLTLSARRGEALKASMDFVAAILDVDYAAGSFPTVTVPTLQPYRFWMLGEVTVGGTPLANINSFDLAWKNGLAARGHAGDATRNAYCIVEEEAEGRYDMQLGVTILDTSLYQDCIEDAAAVDVVIPLLRDGAASWAACLDGMQITLSDCAILDAPVPSPAKGDLQAEIVLGPLGTTEVEIRVPSA